MTRADASPGPVAEVDYETFWDEMASHSRHPSVRLRNRLILAAVRKLDFASLIDSGCGDGYLLARVRQRHPRTVLAGLDLSSSVIRRNLDLYPGIDFRAADLADPDLEPPGSFDVVVASEVIEHIPEWRRALDNLARMTARGGSLVVTTQAGKRYPSDLAVGHVQHFGLAELAGEIERRGFRVISSYRKGWPLYDLQKWLYGKSESLGASFQKGRGQLALLKRGLLFLAYLGFLATPRSRRRGPQIFIHARRVT